MIRGGTKTKLNHGTYGNSDISDATVTNGEALDVLAHLNDFADGFVAGDELADMWSVRNRDRLS